MGGGAWCARGDGAAGDDLFRRIGAFLADHRLSPEPRHYAFAYHVLVDAAGPIARAVERITDGGVRLSRDDIERLGGTVVTGAPPGQTFAPSPAPATDPAPETASARLVARAQVQVEGFSDMVRSIHHETRGFGLDLEASTQAMRGRVDLVGLDDMVSLATTMLHRVHASERRLHAAIREADDLRAQLEEAQGSARRDPLTGLPNRRALGEAFAAMPAGGHGCLAICDVDRFKSINDRFGHAVGDRVLTAIGETLQSVCGDHLTARHGGEEFAILFAGADVASASAVLDAARIAVAGRRFRDRDSGAPLGEITLSAGVGALRPGDTLDTVFRRVDRALYRAKAEGRNRVVEAPIDGE